MDKRNRVIGGLLGLCIGDALGVPVEFESRNSLKVNPLTDMIGYRTHNQPPGTWSDDSSLAFCLAESLCNGLDLQDIANRFVKWLYEGYWTPYGEVFDVGSTTRTAISRLKNGVPPLEAGPKDEFSNGNGSLMRILPLSFYLEKRDREQQFEVTHQVSRLTHGHLRAQMACGIYIQIAINLLKGNTPKMAYERMKNTVSDYYSKQPYATEFQHFRRIIESDISELPKDAIKSSGYVIDTLEASLWCFLNNNSYTNTVLTAVNLGGDTDTLGAVTGGLAGIYYGCEGLPEKWISKIIRVEDIIRLGGKLYVAIYGV
ncbi:ADP-ribosylglycohydrolase family protein [Thermodesulfatator atlanticus]|uniref:ADP-ribosylglycohydrolase family protein n=1 Tax=Thermodesulfatator atlanticus TaxID=501497 RepID=UPI0003B4256F|nr:ADP-ribosylglycohydrolase family protein [Thermodesulfatator atlanticus]